MEVITPLRFGTVEVTEALVLEEGQRVRLGFRGGVVNKVELQMLIAFLQSKMDNLGVD